MIFICFRRFNFTISNIQSLVGDESVRIIVSIDGAESEEIINSQRTFVSSLPENVEVWTHVKNLGVRDFIPYTISRASKIFRYLIIVEDDIVISKESLTFIKTQSELFKGQISLFNPIINSEFNSYTYEGGIWGWAFPTDLWGLWEWRQEKLLDIHRIVYSRLGFFKALYYTPLIALSQSNDLNSWAYNWFYIRLKFNVLSVVPRYSLSRNMGIGDIKASNTRRGNKLSQIELSPIDCSEIKCCRINHRLSELTGYSNFGLFTRVIYNWLRLISLRLKKGHVFS